MDPEENELEVSDNLNVGNLRSDAMHELISRKQGFLSRWALLLFLVVLLILTAATWFIHYPDVITNNAILIATNAPKEIITRQEGRLVTLHIHNGEPVKKGDIIGFIESNANPVKVVSLGSYLDTTLFDLDHNNTQNIMRRFENRFDALGEIQTGYQQFMAACQQFTDYLQDGFYLRKKKVLSDDLAFLQKTALIVQQQKELLLKDLKLSEETYKANESLLRDKVISRQDDRNEQSKLLNKQMSIPQINTALLSNESQQRDKEKEITDLEHTISQQKIIFQQAVLTLQSIVKEWIKKYVLTAAISGRVSFIIPIQENQFFSNGKLLGYINPPDTHYYAEMNLPQRNFGKIKTGQRVQLRFDAYPYGEFGFVNGKLDYITDFATDSGFLAHINLPEGLRTNQRKLLRYHDGMKAEALVITKDMRLLERFYYQIEEIVHQ